MKSCQQKAVEKLLHGHGCANQLKLIMDQAESMEREDLANSVLHCFSDALSILIDTDDDHRQDDQSNTSSPQEYSSPVLMSNKKPLHKRGRKTLVAETSNYRRIESPNPIYHDGFLWRKYGQKQIKESNHERSYYKCAYTKEQNCQAKKQVQKTQHNPPLYSTTYFGDHTCQLHQTYSTFPIDTCDPQDSKMIRFDRPNSSTYQHQTQILIPKDENMMMSPEELSPSHEWMSPEVALAVEAFGF